MRNRPLSDFILSNGLRILKMYDDCDFPHLLNMILVAAKIAVFIDRFPVLAATSRLFAAYA